MPAPQPAPITRRQALSPLAPIGPDHFGLREARHLLWRAGFGGTPQQIASLAEWGPQRAVAHLLDYETVDHPWPTPDEFEAGIMSPLSQEEQRALRQARIRRDEEALARAQAERMRRERLDRAQLRSMQEWWLGRMIQTPRPLEEKLALFWHGHFATGYRTIENSYHMFLQNQLFRSKAAGNFGELLFAIIRDPAMLAYLDNNDSRKEEPNENLARELMELFSLGEGHYAESDIKDGARALTGYSFDGNTFVFRRENHDQGTKHILGRRGLLDGDGFVSAILAQRQCAHFLAAKLYRYFCREIPLVPADMDAPTRRVVTALADELLRARYDLRPALRKLFLSEHFYSSTVVAQQIKSPAELVIGAVRSLGTPVRDLATLNSAMDLMGQALFQPPSVKGWDGGRSWISTSTLYIRQNTLAFLLTGRKPTGFDPMGGAGRFDPEPLLRALLPTGALPTPRPTARAIAAFTLGDAATDRAVEELTAVGESAERFTPSVAADMLLLATAMPEYQLC